MARSWNGIAAAVLLPGMMAVSVQAAPIDLTGYFRVGAGTSNEGGTQVCYRLPGAQVGFFRLGNECDTYVYLAFNSVLGEVDGTTFKSRFGFAYGTQGIANWEQTTPALREAMVEATNIGASTGLKVLEGASLWVGKRFYRNADIHMLDYGYWEANQGIGAGVEDIDVGVGKFSYALMRQGDFTGYGIQGSYNPDLIGGGARSATIHDFRLDAIEVNRGGKLSLGLDLVRANNRDGQSTYTTETVQPVDIGGTRYDLVTRQTHTVDNKPGKNGMGLTFRHTQRSPLGLDGFNDVVLQVARDAASLKGFGFVGSTEDRKEVMLFDHLVLEPKNRPLTLTLTAGMRRAEVDGVSQREFWVGARPQYHLTNVWSLMAEAGYQQFRPEGAATRKLAKLTLGTQFSMGRSIWSRPALRFFGTYAKWNDAAAAAGAVACTGRDCATPVPAFSNRRSGVTWGMQVEGWF